MRLLWGTLQVRSRMRLRESGYMPRIQTRVLACEQAEEHIAGGTGRNSLRRRPHHERARGHLCDWANRARRAVIYFGALRPCTKG